jgi:eukaryotic-like serine/threonine-protein kinase
VGRLGTCVLVKVRHARLGRRFLLKYLSPQASSKAFAAEQFLNAARAAMRLCSEHTARTLDVGYLDSGLPFLVTEAFQGTELREVLRVRGALGHMEAVDVVLQAAESVAEAHRHGFSHGSLSPSTLFVTPGPDGLPLIKVLEFGSAATLREDPLATRLRRWTQGTAIFGESTRLWDTLSYSAPEQLRGLELPTPAVDVWALGAILYEMLTGVPPFRAPNTPALMAAIVSDRPLPPSEISSGLPRKLEAVVLRCLSRTPEARFGSVAEFAAALRRFASPEMRLTVDRIARIQAYDPAQAFWSSSSSLARVPSSLAASSSEVLLLGQRTSPHRPAFWRSVPLALVGIALGALAGTLAARTVPARVLAPHVPAASRPAAVANSAASTAAPAVAPPAPVAGEAPPRAAASLEPLAPTAGPPARPRTKSAPQTATAEHNKSFDDLW